MNKAPLFVTGIGTDVGKTIVSAVLTEQLKADYWKPVQAGDLQHTDADRVRSLLSNQISRIHPERFRLTVPASPHQAAKQDGISISPADFTVPETSNLLLIEGAGGLFVPLSDTFLMVDLASQLNASIVLVVRDYLGCINHTLLSLYAITSKQLRLIHVVFNGTFNEETFAILLLHLPKGTTWSRLPEFTEINSASIAAAPPQLPPL